MLYFPRKYGSLFRKHCQFCPRGAYQDEPQQSTCKLCPADHTTAAPGIFKICFENSIFSLSWSVFDNSPLKFYHSKSDHLQESLIFTWMNSRLNLNFKIVMITRVWYLLDNTIFSVYAKIIIVKVCIFQEQRPRLSAILRTNVQPESTTARGTRIASICLTRTTSPPTSASANLSIGEMERIASVSWFILFS